VYIMIAIFFPSHFSASARKCRHKANISTHRTRVIKVESYSLFRSRWASTPKVIPKFCTQTWICTEQEEWERGASTAEGWDVQLGGNLFVMTPASPLKLLSRTTLSSLLLLIACAHYDKRTSFLPTETRQARFLSPSQDLCASPFLQK